MLVVSAGAQTVDSVNRTGLVDALPEDTSSFSFKYLDIGSDPVSVLFGLQSITAELHKENLKQSFILKLIDSWNTKNFYEPSFFAFCAGTRIYYLGKGQSIFSDVAAGIGTAVSRDRPYWYYPTAGQEGLDSPSFGVLIQATLIGLKILRQNVIFETGTGFTYDNLYGHEMNKNGFSVTRNNFLVYTMIGYRLNFNSNGKK